MPETKDGCKHIGYSIHKLVAGLVTSVTWRTGGGSKLESLLNGQSRKVDVIFGTILYISAVPTL
jgi:hypothetical protein